MHMTWQWVAGFFEGEGHIQWVQGKKSTKQGTGGRIVIGQKDARPLNAVKQFLEESGFERVIMYVRPARPEQRKPNPLWVLTINQRDEVIRFLEHVNLMLYEKQAKAVEVLCQLRRLKAQRDDILNRALALKQSGKTWEDIRRLAHINYHTLNNYARSKGIDLKIPPFNHKRWRDERMSRGLCASCGKPRRKTGTKRTCAVCQARNNERSKLWKRKKRQLLKM